MSQPKLDKSLDIISQSNLEITLLDGDLNIIQALDDEPNDVGGLSAQELKEKFDKAGNIIKEYINGTLIPELLAADATEAARAESEAQREANETVRQENEEIRQKNETERQENEETRAEQEAARQSAEALREEKTAAFMAGVTAVAETISTDSEASAQAVRVGESFQLSFGIPRGRQGVQGPPGPRGLDGVALSASGVFAFNVNEAGDLILSYQGDEPPNFSINDSGELIWSA